MRSSSAAILSESVVQLNVFIDRRPADKCAVISALGHSSPAIEHMLAGDPRFPLPRSLVEGGITGAVSDGIWRWDGQGTPTCDRGHPYVRVDAWYATRRDALALVAWGDTAPASLPLRVLGLGERTTGELARAGIVTIDDLRSRPRSDLLRIPGIDEPQLRSILARVTSRSLADDSTTRRPRRLT